MVVLPLTPVACAVPSLGQAWPLVQSLPELLHHAPTVVNMLLALLEDPVVATQVYLVDIEGSLQESSHLL